MTINKYNICLIATFDHNTGTTACGKEVDTWTIKYPELSNRLETPLQYGYAKGHWRDFYDINCEDCMKTIYYRIAGETLKMYLDETDQIIIDRVNRLKIKLPNIDFGLEDMLKEKHEAREYIKSLNK